MASKAKKPPPTQADFKHTWYIQEWMAQSDPPKIQADMIRELGFGRAKASDVYNWQQYTQELIDVLAPWLNVEPYELLLHPSRAMAIRRMRADALRIAADETAISRDADKPKEAPAHVPARRKAG